MATIRANIPAETGGASGYISGRFAIGSSGLLRLKRRLSRAATWHGKVRSTRSVSQGTEVTIVRGVASFSKVRGMDVVCLLTIKKMNSMTEGYKRYNIQDIKSFPFK